MRLKQSFQIFWVMVVAITLLMLAPLSAFALEKQSNQALNQSAMLIAPEPDFKINIYPKPDTRLPRIGYGLSGDRITVLEQVGSNEGVTWHRVKFDASEDTAGWVRGDFVAFDHPLQSNGNQRQWGNSQQRDRYLGQRSGSTQKNFYSSQTQNNNQQQQKY